MERSTDFFRVDTTGTVKANKNPSEQQTIAKAKDNSGSRPITQGICTHIHPAYAERLRLIFPF
jgi:hypothetical protein